MVPVVNFSVTDVYDAVFDDRALEATCDAIVATIPGGVAFLHYVERDSGKRTVLAASGLGKEQCAALEADETLYDIGDSDIDALRPLTVASNLDQVDRAALRASAAWRTHLGALDLERVDCVLLRKTSLFALFLSVALPAATEDQTVAGARETLNAVAPCLAQAMQLRTRRFLDVEAQCNALVRHIGLPLMTLDDAGRPLRLNEAATRYFGQSRGQTFHAPQRRTDCHRLDDLLGAITPVGESPRDAFFIDREGNHIVATTSAFPTAVSETLRTQWACEKLFLPAHLVLMKVAQGHPASLSDQIVQSFKLTPAERRLLEGILTGMTLSEIAEERHVSYNTLKNQLRSVNEKTGIHRQANLVRVFATLA